MESLGIVRTLSEAQQKNCLVQGPATVGKTVETDDTVTEEQAKELKELASKLEEFFKQQNLPDNVKVDAPKIELQNLNKFINLINTELFSEYVSIRNIEAKTLVQMLMNFGCLYGRRLDENNQMHIAEKCLFHFDDDYVVPEKAIVTNEKSKVVAKEFSSLGQIELEKNGIHSVEFAQGIPIIVDATEDVSQTNAKTTSETTSSRLLYGGYYHPKGSFLLGSILKTLSEDAKGFFKEDEEITVEKMKEFYDEFGTHVPSTVVVGGELMRVEELQQDSKASAETKSTNGKVAATGIVQNWLYSIGFDKQKKKEEKESEAEVQQQLQFEANGGDEKFITDAAKWMSSLYNPDTWKVIRVRGWRKTHDFLEPKIKEQFNTLLEELRKQRMEEKEKRVSDLFTYPHDALISLEGKAPLDIKAFNNRLYVFFPHAIQVFQFPIAKTVIKVPAPWKDLSSTVVLGFYIYAATSDGLFKINLETCQATLVPLKNRVLSRCFLLAYDKHIYAFTDKVLKINPETGDCEVFSSSSSWGGTSCGLIRNKCAYVVLSNSGNLWRLNLETKEEKKISSRWGLSQALIPSPTKENEAYIFYEKLYVIDLDNGAYRQVEDTKYKNYICATVNGQEVYVADKPDPYGKVQGKICLYKVKCTNGARERIPVEWEQLEIDPSN